MNGQEGMCNSKNNDEKEFYRMFDKNVYSQFEMFRIEYTKLLDETFDTFNQSLFIEIAK